MDKVLLIVNPVAGRLKIRTALFDIISVFSEAGCGLSVRMTQKHGDGEAFALEGAKEGYDIICCCGGDGTFNELLSGIMKSGRKVRAGYIPLGSTNDFAKSAGLSSNHVRAAQNIINGEENMLDVGLFNNERYFSYVASFGLFTEVTYSVPQEIKNRIGHLAYVLAGVKDLSEIKAHRIEYTANGETFKGKYILGSVSNSTSIGGVLKFDKKLVDMQDGEFEVMMVHMPKDLLELGDIINAITFSDYSSPLVEF
ncbi:MAG: YegS/Rv2252/BmrU family lipid kinase, partial [Firmicutes bacterium]|nr:YegS/Rv2252/BmrU family lipid kinase [Bacillota bacterium]